MTVERLIEFAATLGPEPGQMQSLVNVDSGRAIEFGRQIVKNLDNELNDAIPRSKPKFSKAATLAGGTLLAGGIATAAASLPLLRVGARGAFIKKGLIARNPRHTAQNVADYIQGADNLLNKGITGKISGKIVQSSIRGRTASGGDLFNPRHFGNFRAGPLNALKHWDAEHSWQIEHKVAERSGDLSVKSGDVGKTIAAVRNRPPNGMNHGLWNKYLDKQQRTVDEMHYGREKTHAAIHEQINQGKNEIEAIKHVAYNSSDPQVQNYFTHLHNSKLKGFKQYAKIATISPGLIAGGAAATVYGRKKNENPRQALTRTVRAPLTGLEALINDLVEFSRGDRLLRDLPELSGVGFRENAYKVASPEDVGITKNVVRRIGNIAQVRDLAERLRLRRKEFSQWRKAFS